MTEPLPPLRCEAIVRRADHGWSTEEITYRDEPCGRRAKVFVSLGDCDVPVCHVHSRKLPVTPI